MDTVRSLIEKRAGKIHMMGVGGVGMAGLAYLLKQRGFEVSGCDRRCGDLCHWLVESGIEVLQDHSAAHAEGDCDLVIYTPAVSQDDLELNAFRKKGVPLARRGEVLPLLLRGITSVAVAGTHGKTTTATFTAHLLKHCGLSVGWCIGGSAESPGGVAGLPDSCDVIVVEADESDGTLLGYVPHIAVVTNVEYDHMEHFDSPQAFEACFSTFVQNASRKLVYCADDPIASKISSEREKAVSFGFGDGSGLRIADLQLGSDQSEFTVSGYGFDCERIVLPCPGRHNVLNAVAAIAVALEFGADMQAIREALSCASLPARRYQKLVDGEIKVITDYAHHPTEIKALVQTASSNRKGRIRAVYQPHRYTRTKALIADFPDAFDGLDEVVIVPVYSASEEPICGGGAHDLYAQMRGAGISCDLLYSRSLSGAWEYYRKTLRPGDTLLVVGAGDVEQIAHWLKRDFDEGNLGKLDDLYAELGEVCGGKRLQLEYPLAQRTMLGAGGMADAFLDVDSVELLGRACTFCSSRGLRMHLLGAGGNIVVSDLGVRGVTMHMSGKYFGQIDVKDDLVSVGAAVTTGSLLDRLEDEGLSGLEFLEGIPGVMGGVVRMNAGAYGGEVGELLERIVCLDIDGHQVVLEKDAITFSYRSMSCLEGRIVLSADFRCKRMSTGVVAKNRAEIRSKREWMKGQRSVGSVFRNPEGEFAGKLIEDCGLKGFTVGGMTISEEHANIFVNKGEATSSDMLSLIDMAEAEVRAKSDVVLEREVVILE